MKLGTLLIQRRLVTPEQLEEALALQVTGGDRLGSILLELGWVTAEKLAAALSEHLQLPVATPDEVGSADPLLFGQLTKDLALRHHVIPLRVEKRKLHVAMVDPGDVRARDALEDRTRRMLVLYVVPEASYWDHVERHYGAQRPRRHKELPGKVPAPPPHASGGPVSAEDRFAVRESMFSRDIAWLGGTEEDDEPVLPETAPLAAPPGPAAAPTSGAPATGPGPQASATAATQPEARSLEPEASPLAAPAELPSFDQVAARLAAAEDREEVAEAIRLWAHGRVEAMVLFYVRQDHARAHAHAAEQADAAQVAALALPLSRPSALREATLSRQPWMGAPPAGEIQERLDAALGLQAAEAIVAPVLLEGRVVNLLYVASRGPDLPGDVRATVPRLAREASAAYGRILKVMREKAGA